MSRPVLTGRWSVLALLCGVRVVLGLQFQAVPATAPFLLAELGLRYAELGLLIGLFQLPGVALALPSGLLGARFGDRNTVLGALAVMSAGTLVLADSQSLTGALLGRLLGGVGFTVLSIQLPKMTTDWFVGKELTTAMGALMSTFPLGVAIALATLGGLASLTSWRIAVLATGAYGALGLGLFALCYRDPEGTTPTHRAAPLSLTLSRRELALMAWSGTGWMLLNVAFLMLVAFGPTLLIDRGRDVTHAGVLVSWASFLSIGSLPLAGWMIDRSHRRYLWMAGGAVAAAVTGALFALGEPAWLWIVLLGILWAPVTSVAALPGTVLRPESRGTGFGVFYTIFYAGMALAPPLAGRLLDVTGHAAAPLWLGSLLWLLVVPVLVGFRLRARRMS
jgi:MFS family permease